MGMEDRPMEDKNEPPRGLEKVSHFFLTGETSSHQDPETSAGNCITNETSRVPKGTLHQHTVEYDRLKKTVAQLYVLSGSCKGIYYTQAPDKYSLWFHGAAAILQDAITNLMNTLSFIDSNK
jgi:hypothetical protein